MMAGEQDQVQEPEAQPGMTVYVLNLTEVGDPPEVWAEPYAALERFCRQYFGKDYARFHGNHAGGHNMQAGVGGIECWMSTGAGEWKFDDEGDIITLKKVTIK